MSCSCNQNPCCCGTSPCHPGNVIYQAECPDPGSVTALRHLLGLDEQFCKRRLLPGTGGYLIARQTGSGTWVYAFSTTPVVDLEEFTAIQSQAFGQLLVQGADDIMRAMNGPAVANLVLGTNAAGQAIWIPIPPATVPDPLTVANLTVTTLATIASMAISGTINFTGLGTTTPAFLLGIDASGNLVKGDPATTGVQVASFFESPTSPSAATPNAGAAAGSLLTIGNLIYDSVLPLVPGGSLFTATNSQTLTCITAGTYDVQWGGQITWDSGSSGRPAMPLLVNGITVNNGNSRPTGVTTTQRAANLWCGNPRRFAVNDTVQVQMGSGVGANTNAYEVRVNFTRTGA